MLDTVVISGDDVCCSVVLGTLVGVFVFSVMWSVLLMTSAISCPLWSSVYQCQRVEYAFISPVRTECGCSWCTVCSVVFPCQLFCSAWMCCLEEVCSVLYVLMVEGMSVVVNVILSLISVMSPPHALCNLSVRTVVKLCTLGVLALWVSLVS